MTTNGEQNTMSNDNIQFDPAKIADLQPWHTTDYLNTDEEIVGYLEAIMESDGTHPPTDTQVLRGAIRDTITVLKKRSA